MGKKYQWRSAQSKNEIIFEVIDQNYDDEALKNGSLLLKGSLEVKISEGKTFYDVVYFNDAVNLALSERLYTLLKKSGITGWKSYEIIIRGKNEKYFGIQITGRCKQKLNEKSGFIVGYEIEEGTWDGADLFSPVNTLSILCSEKIRKMFISNEVTNVKFEGIETVRWYNM